MELFQQVLIAMALGFVALTALIVLALICGVPEAWAHYTMRREAEKRRRSNAL